MAAHLGGSASFTTGAAELLFSGRAVAGLLGDYLPRPSRIMGDRPLSDSLEDVQMGRYVGSGRLELAVPLSNLSLEDVLARRQYAYRGVDGHAEAEDHGAEIRDLQALEANYIWLGRNKNFLATLVFD